MTKSLISLIFRVKHSHVTPTFSATFSRNWHTYVSKGDPSIGIKMSCTTVGQWRKGFWFFYKKKLPREDFVFPKCLAGLSHDIFRKKYPISKSLRLKKSSPLSAFVCFKRGHIKQQCRPYLAALTPSSHQKGARGPPWIHHLISSNYVRHKYFLRSV